MDKKQKTGKELVKAGSTCYNYQTKVLNLGAWGVVKNEEE